MRFRKRRPGNAGIGILPGFIVVSVLAADSEVISDDREYVQRVVDGDTLVLGTRERVRLIGVNTPETKHPQKPVEAFGKEASAFTKRMVEGKLVRLEFDPLSSLRSDGKDRYSRTWPMCSCKTARTSTRRLSGRAMAALLAVVRHSSIKMNFGGWRVRRGSNAADCGRTQ
jgi:endonuclease YncB( thermonuclease family)